MNISPCGTYHAQVENCETVLMKDGVSMFKIYFVSIVGRPSPERFEWSKNALSKTAFLASFQTKPFEGVGFVTAFPHITKVFRFAPQNEVLLHVSAYNTQTDAPVSLDRGEGFTEFACLAEALLASDEYAAWAKAGSVEEYLAFLSAVKDANVVNNAKLPPFFGKALKD